MGPMTDIDDDEGLEETVAVPEALRQKLLKRLQGCGRIIVEVEKAEGKWAKFSAFKTDAKPGEWPSDDDALTQRVATEMHQHWLENSSDEQSLNYRIWCTGFTKQGKRTRPSFKYLYSGPEGQDMAEDDEDDETEVSERVQVLRAILAQNAQMGLRLDEAHMHIRELSASNNKMFEPMNNMVAYAGQMYIAAMEMQKNALFVIHDVKRQDREDKAKDARIDKYIQIVGPALERMAGMFGGFIQNKVMPKTQNGASRPRAQPSSAPRPGGVTPPWSVATPPAPPVVDVEETGEPISNPVADIAQSLYQMLGPGALAKANERLTKREFRLLARLFEAETDGDVVAAWAKIESGGIPATKLLQLYGDFDDEQKSGYVSLKNAVEAHRGA